MSEKIKVNIQCKETIYYNQDVEIDIEDYEKIKDCELDDIDNFDNRYDILDKYINKEDVFDSGQEYLDVQVNKI